MLLVEMGFQELFYKGWLRRQEHSAGRKVSAEEGISVQALPSNAVCMRAPGVDMAARLCVLNLRPVSHWEPFLVKYLLSQSSHLSAI